MNEGLPEEFFEFKTLINASKDVYIKAAIVTEMAIPLEVHTMLRAEIAEIPNRCIIILTFIRPRSRTKIGLCKHQRQRCIGKLCEHIWAVQTIDNNV